MNTETECKCKNTPSPEVFKVLSDLVDQFEDYLIDADEGLDTKLVDDAPESARKAQKEWRDLICGDDGFKLWWLEDE